jgi:sugar transferase (PEP-CTERM system associated)
LIGKLVPASVLGLVFSEAVLTTGAYVVSAYVISDIDPAVWLVYEDGGLRIAMASACILLGFYFQDLYAQIRVQSRFLLLQQVSLVMGAAFLIQALLSYGVPRLVMPRWIMMTGSLFCMAALPLWRIAYSAAVMQGVAAERVMFLGTSAVALEIAAELRRRPELGMTPIGFVADTAPKGETLLASVADFLEAVRNHKPNRIVVGMEERRQCMPVYDLLEVNFSGVMVEDAAALFETVFGRVSMFQLRPSQLIFSRELGPRPLTVKLQSIYSFLIALVGLAALIPVMAIVAILIRLTSRGPILYRQKRVGRNGVHFMLYKFRSMRTDAEAASGAVWARLNDPRITGLGKWLRRLRLDELPQLFNVIMGEMSLVGPRPERPEFVATLTEQIPFYRQRHFIKPGITGWAQINHKYADTLEDTIKKLEYDLYYIKNLSPALDFFIIFHTFKVMLLRRGAQ